MNDAFTHYMKCEYDVFANVVDGTKKFEFRRDDLSPRYQVGHNVVLQESVRGQLTGRVHFLPPIKYVLRGSRFGLPNGFCIFNW